MSEQMLERLREYNRMAQRVEEVEGFLDNCEWKVFTIEDVRKCIRHIKSGGGWL